MLGVFLDTETNGLNPHKHSLLEIAFKIIDVETGELKCAFETLVKQPKMLWDQADPYSLQINGLTWEKISQGLPPEKVSGKIITLFAQHGIRRNEALFICQNPSFDRAFFSQLINPDLQESLDWPYHWLDLASMYWVTQIQQKSSFPWVSGVSKDKISEVYQLPPEEKPHRAMNGVNHLLLCYQTIVGFPQKISLNENV